MQVIFASVIMLRNNYVQDKLIQFQKKRNLFKRNYWPFVAVQCTTWPYRYRTRPYGHIVEEQKTKTKTRKQGSSWIGVGKSMGRWQLAISIAIPVHVQRHSAHTRDTNTPLSWAYASIHACRRGCPKALRHPLAAYCFPKPGKLP